MSLKIKSVNVDNALEVRALISLFDRVCASGCHIYPAVLTEEFWQTRVPSQLLSIVACDRNTIQAHLALSVEQSDGHLLFAAVDPSLTDGSSVLSDMWKILAQSPRAKSLRSLTVTIPQSCAAIEEFASEVLGARACVLLPNHIRQGQNTTSTALATCSQSTRLPDTIKMRIPTRYRQFASKLFSEFGVLVSYVDLDSKTRALSADMQSVIRYTYRDIMAEHLFIEPSLLRSWSDIKLDDNFRTFLFIDTRDPKCPEFCDKAEKAGFIFSGILPFVLGRNSIVFSQCPDKFLDTNRFIDERLTDLADAMFASAKGEMESAVRLTGTR